MRKWIDISEGKLDEGAIAKIAGKAFETAARSMVKAKVSEQLARYTAEKIKKLTGKEIMVEDMAKYGFLIVAAYKVLMGLRLGPAGIAPGVVDALVYLVGQREKKPV